jgi:hypothetical protein
VENASPRVERENAYVRLCTRRGECGGAPRSERRKRTDAILPPAVGSGRSSRFVLRADASSRLPVLVLLRRGGGMLIIGSLFGRTGESETPIGQILLTQSCAIAAHLRRILNTVRLRLGLARDGNRHYLDCCGSCRVPCTSELRHAEMAVRRIRAVKRPASSSALRGFSRE